MLGASMINDIGIAYTKRMAISDISRGSQCLLPIPDRTLERGNSLPELVHFFG
jgi:hypothetical protein